MKSAKKIIPNFLRIKLYKRKRKILKYSKKKFKNLFWEDNVDNLYYGHYHILKRYSKTFLPYKINGEVQHGWSPDHGIAANPFLHDENVKKNRFYLMNEQNKAKSLSYGYSNLVVIGAPFIYLPNINKENIYQSKKSVIFFPLHTHEYDLAGDPFNSYRLYLKEIKKIFNYFSFVTVCLGWREYENKKIIDLFKENQVRVITMGPRDNNPFFLYKFLDAVSNHEYLSSDSFSSAIFYGLIMRKKVFLYGTNMGKGEKEKWEGKLDTNYNEVYQKRYPTLKWENYDHKTNVEIGEYELGLKFKKSPNELREIFNWGLGKLFLSKI